MQLRETLETSTRQARISEHGEQVFSDLSELGKTAMRRVWPTRPFQRHIANMPDPASTAPALLKQYHEDFARNRVVRLAYLTFAYRKQAHDQVPEVPPHQPILFQLNRLREAGLEVVPQDQDLKEAPKAPEHTYNPIKKRQQRSQFEEATRAYNEKAGMCNHYILRGEDSDYPRPGAQPDGIIAKLSLKVSPRDSIALLGMMPAVYREFGEHILQAKLMEPFELDSRTESLLLYFCQPDQDLKLSAKLLDFLKREAPHVQFQRGPAGTTKAVGKEDAVGGYAEYFSDSSDDGASVGHLRSIQVSQAFVNCLLKYGPDQGKCEQGFDAELKEVLAQCHYRSDNCALLDRSRLHEHRDGAPAASYQM